MPFLRIQDGKDDEVTPIGWLSWDKKFKTELDMARHGLITICMRGVFAVWVVFFPCGSV